MPFAIVTAQAYGTAAYLSWFDHTVHAMSGLPSGIVSFLFTDIEGSTRLWERDRVAMTRAAQRHDALLGAAIAAHNGVLFKHVGDAVQAAFASPLDAVAAAVDAQRALTAEPWPETGPIRARMAIHCGEAMPNSRGDYHQVASLNRLSRLLGAGHGGQVLLSDAIRLAVREALPREVTLRDLGRHRLRDLLEPERVAQLVIAELPSDFPPLKTLEGHPTNLPTLPTALIGRETELAAIADLLAADGTRLVTLVGPGGVGKTHLALQAAADLLDSFESGVWLVQLGEVSDPALILATIATTIGVRESGGLDLREALIAWIGGKRLLFVLDNVEQVISGAPAIAALLGQCPNSRVLATSRQRLGIGGERIVPVRALDLAPREVTGADAVAGSAAVRLFVERAQAIAPGFALDDRNALTIATICARLDGLPLAIELAAAQLRTRTLPELARDLERRFDLLVGGRREALSHQRSLAATIAWSYELLDPAAQRLMRMASVFAGGWSREAAEQVAAGADGAPQRLGTLVEQSLVRHDTMPDESSRWSMLESIRAFGRERLEETGEASLAHDQHAAWCLAFAETAGAHLDGADQERWLDRLDLEHDNARAALRWCAEAGDVDRMLALAAGWGPYWEIRGRLSEGRHWLESALRDADLSSATGLRAMVEAGVLAQAQGDFSGARVWYARALEAAQWAGDDGRRAVILNNLGGVALEQGDLDEADRRFAESLALANDLGDQRRRAYTLGNLGAIAHYRGDNELALRYYVEGLQAWRDLEHDRGVADTLLNILLLLAPRSEEGDRARAAGAEGLRRYRALGDPRGEAVVLTGLGIVAATERDIDRAAALFEESLSIAERIEDRATESRALSNLGMVELDRQHLDRAQELLARLLQLVVELEDLDGVAFGLEAMAVLYTARGEDERPARLQGAAGALRDAITVPLPAESRQRQKATSETLASRLGGRYPDAVAAGRRLSPGEAIAEALARDSSPATDAPLATSLQALDDMLGLLPAGDSAGTTSR